MTVVPIIYCDFIAGVYYNITTGYCSLADLFDSATVDVDGLLPNYPPNGPLMTALATGLVRTTLAPGGVMVATWTDAYATPGVPAGEPSSNVFLFDTVGTRGLSYEQFNPPFASTVNFYAAGGEPAAFGDYQGTAVCSWDPTLPQQYISFNGSSVVPGDGVQTVFVQQPGVINSTSGGPPELFRLRFLAFYGLQDIPQTDFPP